MSKRPQPVELLTGDEMRALDLTTDLYDAILPIVGSGETRGGDMEEFISLIHAIQNKIMAQAAARAYPSIFRLLGGSHPRKKLRGDEPCST